MRIVLPLTVLAFAACSLTQRTWPRVEAEDKEAAAAFARAQELLEREQYDEASRSYLELVASHPEYEFADSALNNAAVARESTQDFKGAALLYARLLREYPGSRLAPAALFRVAVNEEKSYQFETAIERYQQLVDEFPDAVDRENAALNRCRLLEALQRYGEAARGYVRFAELFPQSHDAGRMLLRAGLVFEHAGDDAAARSALGTYLAKFGTLARPEDVASAKALLEALEKPKSERSGEKYPATPVLPEGAPDPETQPVSAWPSEQRVSRTAASESDAWDLFRMLMAEYQARVEGQAPT